MEVDESDSGSTDDHVSTEDSMWGLLVGWTLWRWLAKGGREAEGKEQSRGRKLSTMREVTQSTPAHLLWYLHANVYGGMAERL